MTPRQVDQFLVDPVTEPLYPDGKVLFDALWIQTELRELDSLRKKVKTYETDIMNLRETNSQLRNTIIVMESKSPYTYVSVRV